MRRPFIAGNWKMHKTIAEAVQFAERLKQAIGILPDEREVAIAPSFPALYPVHEVIKDSIIRLSAQNVSDREEGALTGEVSARMLAGAGCEYVIIGHSERRILFGEKDDFIHRKIKMALSAGLKPIFCIGETLEEREAGITFSVIEKQIKEGLNNLEPDGIRQSIIAYEPVWAIGTGRNATPEQAQEAHGFIRELLSTIWGSDVGRGVRVIYGGSVNAGNIAGLMAQQDIDGALVGGASLDVDSFVKIVHYDEGR